MINKKYILSIGLSIIISGGEFAIALEMKGNAFVHNAQIRQYCFQNTDLVADACAKHFCESVTPREFNFRKLAVNKVAASPLPMAFWEKQK